MQIEGIDIGQFAALVSLAWVLIQVWIAGKKRDKQLADKAAEDAVRYTKLELAVERIDKSIPSMQAFLDTLQAVRTESREDHEKHVAHLDEQMDRLRNETHRDNQELSAHLDRQVDKLQERIDHVAEDAKDGRAKLHTKLDRMNERIDSLRK